MLKSMTAFSRVDENYPIGNFVWEVRSINHRYLEVGFRLPEELRSSEFDLRKQVQNLLSRGKVDCTFRLKMTAETDVNLSINETLLDRLLEQTQILRNKAPNIGAPNPIELLSWPGVTEQAQIDQVELTKTAKQLFDQAIKALIENRKVEGDRMRELISQRSNQLKQLVSTVRERRPEVLTAIRTKLIARIEEMKVDMESNRFEQELVMIAQKLDVDEELDRLDSHLTELDDVLVSDKPVGRRLDFLMQELNREANTLSSKSADIVTTQAAVDMKVNIEQMREQVQNIE
ncbi:MAG: YicC/YloC family endoribonuclease [Gammaproteobacteria bacterium]|nr:YicC/YloC family endoribonuclease [Gammaproteobacteria bacterium]